MNATTQVVLCCGLPDRRQALRLRQDLPAAEWAWIQRLRQPADRLRSLTGRALARRLLAQRLRRPPAAIELAPGAAGKPALAADAPAWHFNIAHSGALVLVAVGPRPLGVDLEHCPAQAQAGLWRMVTGRETGPSARAFCNEWVQREAALKACGAGFTLAPAQLRLGPADRGWRRIDGAPQVCGLHVRLLWQSSTHCAALCLPLELRDWRLARTTPAQWLAARA